jgi:hypothetical protein
MHFNRTGWVAHYDTHDDAPSDGEQRAHARDVEAWHTPSGEALVVDVVSAMLVPATSLPGFLQLEPVDTAVAALPGGGWRMTIRGTNGEAWTEPVPGWLVGGDGITYPLRLSQGLADHFDPKPDESVELHPPVARPVL